MCSLTDKQFQIYQWPRLLTDDVTDAAGRRAARGNDDAADAVRPSD